MSFKDFCYLLLMSGGAYKEGDRVELGISQLEREGSLSEPGLIGSKLIDTDDAVAPSFGKALLLEEAADDDCGSLLGSDYLRNNIRLII